MALLEEHVLHSSGGMVKKIEASAYGLVLQNLQIDQYQYPEKSFIRETASNCVDSINEKLMAISILSGESKVEDHYIDLETDITKDSKFDKDYYDVNYLNPENKVIINYINKLHDTVNRDQIIISDTGVGLGRERLQGYFRPAYSTKRLNAKSLGRFGIGSKAGLSTGVESFKMISRYNGRKYSFDIYNDRFFSTIEKFNSDGTINPSEIWEAERYNDKGELEKFNNVIYYEETKECNSVDIIIDVKNPLRNKTKYFDAIKQQLCYFDYIEFLESWENDRYSEQKHDISVELLYKDENLIIPKYSNYYDVPHLILNGVNYGTIDFSEMEMDTKKGNIGIIGNPSEIDVNQSRESVRYSEKTRTAIKKYLENSISVANGFIEKELSDSKDDLLRWLSACNSIKSKTQNNNLLHRLSGLTDMSGIKLKYKDSIDYTDNINRVFDNFKLSFVNVNKTSRGTFKTNTSNLSVFPDFTTTHLIYRENSEGRINALTLAQIGKNIFDFNYKYYTGHSYVIIQPLECLLDSDKEAQNLMTEELLKSKFIVKYDDTVVTDEYLLNSKGHQEEEEKEEARQIEYNKLSKEEIRKRDGKFIFSTYYVGYDSWPRNILAPKFTKKREELDIDKADREFSKEDTIYGTLEDCPLIEAILHTFPLSSDCKTEYVGRKIFLQLYNKKLKIIVVAKNNVKYIKEHATYIKDALQTVENKTIKVMEAIKLYNTAKLFVTAIKSRDFAFLEYFEQIDVDAYNSFLDLTNYCSINGYLRSYSREGLGQMDIDAYLQKIAEYQLLVLKTTDAETLKAKSTEFFNTPEIENCEALDLPTYSSFKALEDYIENIKELLRPYGISNGTKGEVNPGVVKEYLKLKQVGEFSEYLKERDEEFKVTRVITNKIEEDDNCNN